MLTLPLEREEVRRATTSPSAAERNWNSGFGMDVFVVDSSINVSSFSSGSESSIALFGVNVVGCLIQEDKIQINFVLAMMSIKTR